MHPERALRALKAGRRKAGRSPPLTELAVQALRHRILRGDVTAGQRLRIEALQQEHATSSTPLREALNRLVSEGLVTTDDHRGFRVAGMSPEDLQDITAIRLIVEPAALALSIAHGNDEWEGRVVATYHQLARLEQRMAKEKSRLDDEWSQRHRAYHMALLSAAPSNRLLAVSSSLFDQAERYRWFSIMNRTRPRNTANEHHKMMEAVIGRQSEVASALLREHILMTTKNVLTILGKR